MKRAQKLEQVERLKAKFDSAEALFISDYRGIPVNKITELRFNLRKSGADLRVVKNRLALRALEGGLAKSLESHVDNMTVVAIANEDIAATAKVLTSFAKDNEALKLRAGVLEGKVISLADIKALSVLPGRQELLGQLAGVMAAVPTGFVRVLNAIPGGFVNVLSALKSKKEEGS